MYPGEKSIRLPAVKRGELLQRLRWEHHGASIYVGHQQSGSALMISSLVVDTAQSIATPVSVTVPLSSKTVVSVPGSDWSELHAIDIDDCRGDGAGAADIPGFFYGEDSAEDSVFIIVHCRFLVVRDGSDCSLKQPGVSAAALTNVPDRS